MASRTWRQRASQSHPFRIVAIQTPLKNAGEIISDDIDIELGHRLCSS